MAQRGRCVEQKKASDPETSTITGWSPCMLLWTLLSRPQHIGVHRRVMFAGETAVVGRQSKAEQDQSAPAVQRAEP